MIRGSSKWGRPVMLLVLCLISGLFLIPKWHSFRLQKQQWDQLHWMHSDEKLWKNYQAMKEEKVLKAKYVKGLENQLYGEKQLSQVIEFLQTTSLEAQIEILHYNLGGLVVDKLYPVQNLKLTIQGRYEGIIRFLSLMGSSIPQKKIFFTIHVYDGKLSCAIDLDFYLQPKRGEEVS